MTEPTLENWAIVAVTESVYHAPEQGYAVLTGNVYGKNGFEPGDDIVTTRIVKIDPNAGWVETRNTTYRLGDPNPDFKRYLEQNGYKFSDYKFEVTND